MKKLTIQAILFISMVFSFQVFSQDPASTQNALTDMQIKTPGLTDFIKYGNLSSTSYVGELKINLPLISIPIPKNNPFEINLTYVASGFRPNKRDGLVGQNWFLNVGGVITRQVNTMPDTQKGDPQGGGGVNHTNGFILGVQSRTNSPQAVFDFNTNATYRSSNFEEYLFANSNQNTLNSNNYEGDPDIFSFNFNGISGKFFMGNDGEVKIATNTPNKLTVDLTELNYENILHHSCLPNFPSRITITDDGGNKYYFGGETRNLEYTLTLPNLSPSSGSGSHSDDRAIINAWYLYRVVYYTGYVLNFNYRDDSELNSLRSGHFGNQQQLVHNGFPEYTSDYIDNIRDFVVLSEYYSENRSLFDTQGSFHGTGAVYGYSNNVLSLSLQKIAILESITGEDFEVNFGYSRQNKVFNTRDPNNPNETPVNNTYFKEGFFDIRIDNISFRRRINNSNTGGNIKSFKFTYDYLGGTHSRMFLTSLKESGLKTHTFDYYATGSLPKPITRGIDHWGFWNGNNANTNQLIPTVTLQTNGDFYYNTLSPNYDSRDPDFNDALKGQLERITYPTGGYSEFEYESHWYTKRLEARSEDDFKPNIYTVTLKTAGGVRINKITDFENNDPTNIKEYSYTGGTLLKWPRYAMYYVVGNQGLGYIRSNPIGKNIMESLHMTYSEVTEQTSENGRIVTKFRDFTDNGDDGDDNWKTTNWSQGVSFTPSAGLAKNYYAYLLNDRSIERGKPRWTKIYDAFGNIKEETYYEYNENESRFNQFTTAIHLTGPFNQANKLYYYSDFLTKSTNSKFLSGGVLTTIQENVYDYSTNRIVTSNRTNMNSNNVLRTDSNYSFITNEHLVLLDDSESFNNGQLVGKQEIDYGNNTDPDTNYKYYPKEITNYKFSVQQESTASKVIVHKYDTKGNPLEVSKSDGTHTCYIWGYGEFLLIAKIENATYSQISPSFVSDLQNLSDIDNNNDREDDLRQALNDLRNEPTLSSTLITTYTHDPHVGVTSITDLRGNTVYYEYDVHERLIAVRDKDGNKLNRTEYNYQPQN